MKRRSLLQQGVAGIAMPAWAQPARDLRRMVGVLGHDASDGSGPVWEAFVEELARRGFVEGRNLRFERRFAEDARVDVLDRHAAELAALGVDLIYALGGSPSALAAQRATTRIPIVFFAAPDPVASGLVASLAQPGGNVTGTSTLGLDIVSKGLQFLAEAVGAVRRFVMFLPEGARGQSWFARSEAAIVAAGVRFGAMAAFVEVRDVEQLSAWLRGPERRGVDAVMLFDFPVFRPHLAAIAAQLVTHRLPSYGWAQAGFLLHYDVSRPSLARGAAAYVDRILRGARPADLPVEQVREFELAINLRTARALGLNIPAALLVRADTVIE
jgi:putative ABC transport system substrate-binding protein